MSTHKHIDKICALALVLALALTLLFMNGKALGLQEASRQKGYEARLFDTGRVHTIDIVMDDWQGFLSTCENEEYTACAVVIDGEAYKNVGLRAKGNTSLTRVAEYGNDRYSFKIEFDHYDSTKSYFGLDKLSLNNIIQDNTYMKDYLSYQMMGYFGVPAPLCSYAQITVNGEDWGLYLAVEGIEESFLQRNYGKNYGELYKPDSQSMGGGRGNGGGFDMDGWQAGEADGQQGQGDGLQRPQSPGGDRPELPEGMEMPEGLQPPEGGIPGDGEIPDGMQRPEDGMQERSGMGGPGGMGADDVSLLYSDDEYSSYENIFENAKTDVTNQDKDRLIAALKRLNEGQDMENTVDVEEVIRYFVVHNFVCNFDSYTGGMIHNYYLYEQDGQLSMLPWDYNLAFGGFQGAQDATALANYPIDTPVSGGTVDSRPMLAWIFADEGYTQLYHQYFQEFITGYFDSGAFTDMLDAAYELIAPYVEQDPTKFCTYEEFQQGAAVLREFCLLRAESISGQLAGDIPSTSSGQAQAQEALVDASALEISAMGGMEAGRGGEGFPGGPQAPGQEAGNSGEAQPEPEQEPGQEEAPSRTEGDAQAPQGEGEAPALPDGEPPAMPEDGGMPGGEPPGGFQPGGEDFGGSPPGGVPPGAGA